MRIVQATFWWCITLLTLLVLDDLVFGPVFWLLALTSPVLSTIAAFMASLFFQLWLIQASLRTEPNGLESIFLKRFMLTRKSNKVAEREIVIKGKIISAFGAFMATPLIGGVVPILILHKYGITTKSKLRYLGVLLSVMYALEFAMIHGGYGIGATLRVLV